MEYFSYQMDSPIGPLTIVRSSKGICSIDFEHIADRDGYILSPNDSILQEAAHQLGDYFEGKRKDFSLNLDVYGTNFQKTVWKALETIPFGETRSYQQIAEAIGNPKAVRAVGQANKSNPVPIIIPCHRVIGKNRALTGYAGKQTDKKEKLLTLEGAL
ncbi:MAG TPA: methylated-DNA--[protein]-cysteine S-methyltransferase [Chondromyces sp.]|nr:methylated-DNA--[protein]-cysteine S-methyltransferase [Chondromyces sp.]